MVWIPAGTFRMGSNDHYPEEAPVHRVTVDGFWIDRTPVANRQFKAFGEILPDPKNYRLAAHARCRLTGVLAAVRRMKSHYWLQSRKIVTRATMREPLSVVHSSSACSVKS
jgi:formylglycine-generating enzyme required for sulfatase activity